MLARPLVGNLALRKSRLLTYQRLPCPRSHRPAPAVGVASLRLLEGTLHRCGRRDTRVRGARGRPLWQLREGAAAGSQRWGLSVATEALPGASSLWACGRATPW